MVVFWGYEWIVGVVWFGWWWVEYGLGVCCGLGALRCVVILWYVTSGEVVGVRAGLL